LAQFFLLRGARQLLTLRGSTNPRCGADLSDLGIIPDGSVLIRDGLILSVGTTRRLENLKEARGAIDIPVHGKVVMPAFVDAGLHLTLNRSEEVYKPKRIAEFYEDSLTLLRACLQHGTVTAEVKASADSHDYHSDIAVLRKLSKIGSNPVRILRTWRIPSPSQSLGTRAPSIISHDLHRRDLQRTLETMIRRSFLEAVAVEPQAREELDPKAIELLKAAGLSIQFHSRGGDSKRLLEMMEFLHPRSVCFTDIPSKSESTILAKSGVCAVLPAGKRLFDGPVAPSGRELIDAGVPVALSSGYHSISASSFSMQMSVALAVARLGLTVEEAISAATVNSAYALGCGALTGSLEVGKQADLLVMNVSDYREIPQQFGINHVAMVFRSGDMVINRTRWRPPTEQPAHRVRPKLL
jgi:imidazolonepropionase